MGVGILIGMGSIIIVLAGLMIFSPTRDIILYFFKFMTTLFFNFVSIMPKPLKLIMFLFFLIFIIGGLSSSFLSLFFFCDGNIVYRPTNLFNGVGLGIASVFQGNIELGNLSNSEYQSVLNNESVIYFSPDNDNIEGIIQIQCNYNEPNFTFFGLEIFNYRYWVMLLILSLVVGFYFKFTVR